MADQKEPKKETVRITLPPRPAGQPAPPATGRDTVRINLPARPPATGILPRPPASAANPAARPPQAQTPVPPAPARPVAAPPVFRKPPTPPSAASAPAAASPPLMPRPAAARPLSGAASGLASAAGPKKETARITVSPEPAARPGPAVEMKKTQPLVTMPEPRTQAAEIAVHPAPVATEESSFIDEIPMALCWALLAASVAILTIQIWNYVS